MLFELSMVPLNGHMHTSSEIAEVVKIIDASGLAYRLTPTGTCLEGTWEEVMPVIHRCHDQMCQLAPHVLTTIGIEYEDGAENMLEKNIESVREKADYAVRF